MCEGRATHVLCLEKGARQPILTRAHTLSAMTMRICCCSGAGLLAIEMGVEFGLSVLELGLNCKWKCLPSDCFTIQEYG